MALLRPTGKRWGRNGAAERASLENLQFVWNPGNCQGQRCCWTGNVCVWWVHTPTLCFCHPSSHPQFLSPLLPPSVSVTPPPTLGFCHPSSHPQFLSPLLPPSVSVTPPPTLGFCHPSFTITAYVIGFLVLEKKQKEKR